MQKRKKLNYKCDRCGSVFERRTDVHKASYKNFNACLCKKCSRKEAVKKLLLKKRKLSEEHKKKMLEARRARYPSFTIDCKCCGKTFKVPYGERERMYCGRVCQAKSIVKKNPIIKTSNCLECKKDFKHYSERKYCSVDCSAKASSRLRLGENNPAFLKDSERDKGICPRCNKVFFYTRVNLHKNQKRIYCSLFCVNGHNTKKNELKGNSPKYPREFRKIKPVVKTRDKNKCIMCASKKSLEVHHINYDKIDCSLSNLVTLCKRCHTITHHERFFWEQLFTGLNSGCKIVKKGWGLEIHYCNNNKYCLKHLIFFKGKKFSLHSHNLKSELWLVSWGEFECFIKNKEMTDLFILKKGETILLEPGTEHQVQATKNSIITEVSTTDFPEDSYRKEKGDITAII